MRDWYPQKIPSNTGSIHTVDSYCRRWTIKSVVSNHIHLGAEKSVVQTDER